MGSAEFRFLVDCCRRSFADAAFEDCLPPERIDWHRFLRLARFHRVEGLAWNALSANPQALPEPVRSALAQAASRIAAQNLQAAAACRALLDTFEAANVPLLFLKGLTLGALAYGNPAIKAAIDIDLLIDPADLSHAAKLMRRCGYRLLVPADSEPDRILHKWHRGWKESVWAKDSPSLQIDLHTRTADNRRLIPVIDVHSPAQRVSVGSGVELPTLADEPLFAYLAVHGASSAWFRLKWIADFAALLHGRPAANIESLYRTSQSLGAGRSAGQALFLADALFGSLEEVPTLRDELARDPPTVRLFRATEQLVAGEPREPTERIGGTFTIHWTQLLLLPGSAYKLSELSRQARRLLTRIA